MRSLNKEKCIMGGGSEEIAFRDFSTLMTRTRSALLKYKVCSGDWGPHAYLGPKIKPGPFTP